MLNQVEALVDWGIDGNVTSARWQVTLCDPMWCMSSHTREAGCLLYLQL